MNTTALTATLTRDPDVRIVDGLSVCSMRVAGWDNPESTQLFIDVAVFGQKAEICQRELRKGQHIVLYGRLRFREWENGEGKRRSQHTIVADRIYILPQNPKSKVKDEGVGTLKLFPSDLDDVDLQSNGRVSDESPPAQFVC